MARKTQSNFTLELLELGKKAWEWLNGRKQSLALFALFAIGGLKALQEGGLGDFTFWINALGSLGSGHKIFKGV